MKTAYIPLYGNSVVYIKYCAVLSKNRLYTKMLRVHLFIIFIIKDTLGLAASLSLLMVKTLTKRTLTISHH